MTTLEILEKLIAFPTVSRDPNRDLIDFIQTFLLERGVASELVLAEDGKKANLFATIGPSDVPGVMLSGHTDVVPVDGQSWSTDPFALTVRGGNAYGRGAADMKGFVASVLSLVNRVEAAKLNIPIHFAFSHDEEIGCVGVRSLIDRLAERPLRPRLCIVGEPTSMRVATGHKGKLSARAVCHGVGAHSAVAPNALNAIHLACEFVDKLRSLQDDVIVHGARDADYEIPYTTIHAGKISGGIAVNIVADRCIVDFEIRNVAGDRVEDLLDRLTAEAAALAASRAARFPQAAIKLERLNDYPGLATQRNSEVVTFMQRLCHEPALFKVAFGTEGGLFSDRLGIPTVICGPGSMDQGHKPDEYVGLDQLAACDRMLDRLIDQLSG